MIKNHEELIEKLKERVIETSDIALSGFVAILEDWYMELTFLNKVDKRAYYYDCIHGVLVTLCGLSLISREEERLLFDEIIGFLEA